LVEKAAIDRVLIRKPIVGAENYADSPDSAPRSRGGAVIEHDVALMIDELGVTVLAD
jgi:hypothetical protein